MRPIRPIACELDFPGNREAEIDLAGANDSHTYSNAENYEMFYMSFNV
jgi:hypothetical protein